MPRDSEAPAVPAAAPDAGARTAESRPPGSRYPAARLLVPVLVLAFLAAFGVSTRNLAFEARIFPLGIGALVLLLVLVEFLEEARTWRRARRDDGRARSTGLGWRDVVAAARPGIATVALTAGLIAAARPLGFFVALPVFLLALLLVLGVRPWWRAALTAALYTAGVFAVFDGLMGLRLP